MKRLLILTGILAACLSASAQINRIEYFWDTDPGFGSGIGLPITPGDSVSAVFTFSTIGLLPGVHTLYIRSRDASGRWSVFSKKAIRIQEAIYPISKAEYFYDTDPGFGNGTPLPFTPPLDSLLLAPGIPTNALAPGLHTLYVRVRDTNGKWSVFSKKAIHIQQPVYPISNAEYFVDTDPGFGNGTPIPITPGDSIDTIPAINTISLAPGIHTVYIRVKTTNGEWSVFSKRPIHIQYPESPLIVAAEAFVDSDPGFGNGTPISLTSGGDTVLANFSVPTALLSLGIHMVYVRVKDSNNQWSVFSKKLIYIDNPADDPIIAAEYFIDNDPGIGNATAISINSGDSVLANFIAPTDTLLIGPHHLYVRVKDAEARWSVYSKDSFYVGNFNCAIYGNGEIALTGDTCRGTQLTFKDKTTSNSGVNSNDYTREWDFFYDGSVDFTDSTVNYTFNQTGTYTVKLKVNEIANPFCQEVIIKTLTIRRIDTTYNNVTICTGESYNAGGGNQTTSGIYYDTYNNRYGCDSVRVTDLTVDSNLTASVTIAVEDTNVCSGVSTVFTATPVNGGTPYFTWKVNGTTVGAGYAFQGYNPFGISTLTNGQTVTCEMLSSITCASSNPATSNSIIMNVTQSVATSITIDVDTNNFCTGTTATFTVTNVTNQGSNPKYDWYVDNGLAQTGGITFTTSTLVSGNFVRCYLTSDEVCVSNSPVSSNLIYMTVFGTGYPDVSIQTNANSVCYGTPIGFTAFSSLGGNNPNYQWFLNDTLSQSGSSNTYSNDTLDDNDKIKCVLTSDYQCRLADYDTSNTVTMDIIYNLPVSISLTPNGNNICQGTSVTFTALVTNGGSPNYQFFLNGTSAQNGPLYYYSSSALNDKDSVWVVVTSDISCASNNPATSNKVFMNVVKYDTVSVSIVATDDTICEGTNVTYTATALNPGAAPTYLWRVNNVQVQSGLLNTYNSASLGNGSIVKCELYGDHQCVTPNPAVSNSISMMVTDTLLPVALVSVPQNLICEGTNVNFTATIFNEGNNPTIEWLLNNNVVQTGGLTYSSSTLQDFDAVRVRLTSDYVCPKQNPVLSSNVVMTVIDSITPAVFAYHGPNPACPGNLISVFTTTSTGGSLPIYEFRKNGNIVQSGQQSQYTSSNFTNGDVMQVTMTSNASCLKTTTALSNSDTIKIQSFIAAGVSIQVIAQASCAGDTTTFEATTTTGGLNPIFTWRVNNAVFQSSGSSIFNSTALLSGDSVFCEMNSSLSCATNNPARSNTIAVQLLGCCQVDGDCNDFDQCTNDGCNSGTCVFRPKSCGDNNACTVDSCFDGTCINSYSCNDGNACNIDLCDTIDGCYHTNLICIDGNLCTVDNCNTLTGCTFTPLNCNDGNACTDDLCDTQSGLCVHDTIQGCSNPCDTLTCSDNDLCTTDSCANGQCVFAPINCSDGDLCTNDSCTAAICSNTPVICDDGDPCTNDFCLNGQCLTPPVNCDDSDACTLDNCQGGTCSNSPVTCNDGSACTTDSCDVGNGCFYTSIICNDGNICTADNCSLLTGCTFTPLNCNDGNACTDDFCDILNGLCVHDTIQGCGNPCDTLTCIDNNACTIDNCINGACAFPAANCDDGNLCTADGCNPISGCTFIPINCDDGNSCTDDFCDTLNGLCVHDTIQGCSNPCDTLTCFDNNACTIDNCINGACAFPAINCDDGNLCTTDGCNPFSGCTFIPVNCEDGNACTDDFCDVLNGLCVHDTIQGCGNPCDTITCFDNNLCTSDTCLNGACAFTGINCNDGDACTLDSCFSLTGCFYNSLNCDDSSLCTSDGCNSITGCVFIPQTNCNDGNACTDDICNALTGLCTYDTIQGCGNPCDTITCIDNSLCTTDGCDSVAGCLFTAIVCDDSSLCTADDCDPFTGCVFTSLTCDDNDFCTIDDCDPLTGCTFTPIVCSDGNICTLDTCNIQTGCSNTTVNCNDGDACTNDSCDPLLGCQYAPHNCNDGDVCSDDSCDPLIGCQYIPQNCNDGDACSDDSCDPLLGCQYIPHNCNDGDACTDDSCDPLLGCQYTPHNCNDGDACTDDSCDPLLGCQYTPHNCNDGDACTDDSCDPLLGCQYVQHNCNDGDACSDDSCDPLSGCQYAPHNCNDGDACSDDSCDPLLGCQYATHNCNDGNACSDDSCDPLLGCLYATHNCNDGSACTLDSCNAQTGCFYTAVVCNDNDLCTNDTCQSLTGCIFTPINCDDSDSCTVDKCEFGVCVNVPVPCNDGDACTLDSCIAGTCSFFPINCIDIDACTDDACDLLLGCQYSPHNCDDSDACTDDSCNSLSGCQYAPHNCDDGDACTDDACDIIFGCQYVTHNCDDSDACTDDSCDPLSGCQYTLHNCNDGDACTNDACDVLLGCQYALHNCNDGDACTDDSCDPLLSCQYAPHNCNDGNSCTNESCDPTFGCAYLPVVCDDNDACTVDACDSLTGCLFTPVSCDDNNLCTIDTCVNGACQFTDERKVLSFTLVDADDDIDIGLLTNGAVIDLYITGPISIRADVCPTSNIESVKFFLNGSFYVVENIPFFTIAGDNNGNYNPWNVQPGVYTIRAIPYNGNNGTGIVGIYNEITITIIDNTPPCGPNDRIVLDFTLVDASTDADIGQLNDGDTVNLAITPSINVRANVCLEDNIESVKFLLNGNFFVTENIPFYTIAGDNNGNYNPWNVQPGVYTIHATPYSGNNGTGIVGTFNEITIVIIDGTPPCGGNDRKVVDFTLIDASTDGDIGQLNDGDTINLAITPSINVRANVCLESNIESVKFLLNGNFFVTENIPFYTIAGDNNGNYNAWNVVPGVYTIRATPYNGNNGAGIVGTFNEITIVIIDGTPPCGGNDRKVVDFTLVDASTDSDIGQLNDGDTINLAITPSINVRANVCLESNIESVKFLLNGILYSTENISIYSIAGDNNGNYFQWNVQPGVYTIRATPYSGNNGTGIVGTFNEITIVIIDGTQPCQVSDIRVTSFTLVSEASNTDIGSLVDGAVIDLTVTGKINVRANVFCEDHIESVKFKLNANNSYRIENIAPYALAGDANSDYFTWNVSAGIYTIQATPYSENNAGGTAGTPLSITITIVGSAAKMDAEEQLLNEPAEDEATILNAYPNPFKDILNIEFSLQEDSKVKLEIFNIAGQKITTLFEGDVKASALQKFEYKPRVASDGMIIYRLQTNNTTFYGKAVMVK